MFTKSTEYAIRALVYVILQNSNGRRPGFKEIAKGIDSPEPYLAKILQNLTKLEIIKSAKGRGGGFFFPNPERKLPLFEVIKVTEGESFFTKCGFGLNNCDANNPCPVHEHYKPIREQLFSFVMKESIQSLAGKVENHEAVLTREILNQAN